MANPNPNPNVFFDIAVSGKLVGRIEMELFADKAPLTAENFRALCTGEKGFGESGKPLHFKGSIFHEVHPGTMWCGGDIIDGDGSLGESIYGRRFLNENYAVKHDRPGILSMATGNKGDVHFCGSEFMIVMKEDPYLDGVHVAFGRVTKGWDVIRRVDKMVVGTYSWVPKMATTIANCGQIPPGSEIPGSMTDMEVSSSVVTNPSTLKRFPLDLQSPLVKARLREQLRTRRLMIIQLQDELLNARMEIAELKKALAEQATAQKIGQGEGV